MPKSATSDYPAKISSTLSEKELECQILQCYPVRRPLDIPSITDIYGDVLSHSAILGVSSSGSFLIEFMADNIVYVKKVHNYVIGEDFVFNGLKYIHDCSDSQSPEKEITLSTLANTMANCMAGKKFDTLTHNCHIARYRTLKTFGMKSNNPNRVKKDIIHQGFIDLFFRPNSKSKSKGKLRYHNNENIDVTQISSVQNYILSCLKNVIRYK